MLGGCAQAYAPPGGERDTEAPRVESSTPAANAVVPDFHGAVVIKFSETLSERGPRLGEQVMVSPESGTVEVKRHGNELKITVAGGWQKNRIYHVTVMPGWADRFGNARRAPYDLIFSTGPQILPTALGGIVTDRLTGRPVPNARIQAISFTDSTTYTSTTDTAGFFVMQGLPVAGYTLNAFLDTNRNRKADGAEPRQSTTRAISTVRDTQIVEMSLLARDTTPARLLRAEAKDSLQVRLTFDDYFDPAEPQPGIATTLWQLPDSTPGPGGTLIHVTEFERRERALRDTTTTRRAPQDTAKMLPTQQIIFVPAQPLRPGTKYRIKVLGIRNINGVPNGGGSTTFETAVPPKPATPRK